MDSGAARRQLGFVARTPLEQGLRRTIQWYRGRSTATLPPDES
jgi:nucleoside-diphosphate-sugar epimerase